MRSIHVDKRITTKQKNHLQIYRFQLSFISQLDASETLKFASRARSPPRVISAECGRREKGRKTPSNAININVSTLATMLMFNDFSPLTVLRRRQQIAQKRLERIKILR